MGLLDEVIATSKNSVAAGNRFIYYPDRLVSMPHPSRGVLANIYSIFTEPVFDGLIWAVVGEGFRDPRSAELKDESVGSFLRRRMGTSQVGDNIVSAVLHGIYAGDIEQLSIKSLMPTLWYDEGKHASVSNGLVLRDLSPLVAKQDWQELQEFGRMLAGKGSNIPDIADRAKIRKITNSSVYSFKRGIGTLSEALENYLRSCPNVKIHTGYEIDRVEYVDVDKTVVVSPTAIKCPHMRGKD